MLRLTSYIKKKNTERKGVTMSTATIKKAAVLGSGVMGSGIAAHLANAGVEVLLLDIVLDNGKDRSQLAKAALERLKAQKPDPLAHPDFIHRITPGNLEDDLEKLRECDWIIEAVLEKLEVKHKVYSTVAPYRKADAVVSSNTSTIPLQSLIDGQDEGFQKHFMITHFFNPARYMRLLELVKGEKTDNAAYERIKAFNHIHLGKGYVRCNDTPGFIANRIGVYWLCAGLLEGLRIDMPVSAADAVMGKPLGIPKTGVFGLFDLIGIDLLPLIAKELKDALPANDPFCIMYEEPPSVRRMIEQGYTGRKGKGGFYRMNKLPDGKKVKEELNLQTSEYIDAESPKLASIEAAKSGLRALVEHEDIGGKYAKAVLMPTLHYAASLVGIIAGDILAIDRAICWGYNWKYGPLELIDRLGTPEESGTAYFARWCQETGREIPKIITAANGRPLYELQNGNRHFLTLNGQYEAVEKPQGVWLLADKKSNAKPVKKNGSAQLWDLGDGVLGLEYTSKMNSMDPDILSMMVDAVEIVKKDFKGLVIGTDGDNFSVGANLGFFLFTANTASWSMLSDVIRQGQNALMGLKYAPFPVVAALNGMALGGGCETILHCDAIQAHLESYPGLVEVGVGVIPGWGGCKEMLLRHLLPDSAEKSQGGLANLAAKMVGGGGMPAVKNVFEIIALAKVGESAYQARDMRILNAKSRITMNRDRLLPDAKELCLQLAEGYVTPVSPTVKLPGKSGRVALDMAVKGLAALGKVTPHDQVVVAHLAEVLTGGNYSTTQEITEQQLLDLEHDHFMELVKLRPTLDRIEYMLENNKPLRN